MIGILFIIFYLSGWIFSFTACKKVFARKDLNVWMKIGYSIFIWVFSWIGYLTWNLVIEVLLDQKKKLN